MKPYLAIFKARLLTLMQYRAAALAGICTQIFWGIIYSMILTAFYGGGNSRAPITLEQALNFIWINQALFLVVPWNIDKEIEAQIKTGNVAYELVRPLNLYWLWFTRALALRVVPCFVRAVPLFIVSGLFFALQAPVSWQAALAFGGSLFCSLLLSSAITTVVTLSLFWTISGEGILRLVPHIAMFLSGLVVPLPLFPEWLQPFMMLQPFRAILDIPCRLYTGVIPVEVSGYYIAFQLGWTLLFIAWGKWLVARATHKVVLLGG